MQDIWTVILNWKRPAATCACLATLLKTVDPATVIVIDNGSHDGSVEHIRQQFPQVVLLPLPHNYGFARAVNIGIRHALERGAWGIFLLNNDTLVAPDTLPQLRKAMQHTPDLGLVSARVFLVDAPDQFWAVGGIYRRRRVIHLGAGQSDHGQYDHYPLDFVYMCAVLLRADMIQHIGGFDERFFMYYEDVDLGLRARAAGYQVALASDARVWHYGSLSTREQPGLKLRYEACSRLRFFDKHLSGWEKGLFYLEELRYVLVLTIRRLRAGQHRIAMAYLRGCATALSVILAHHVRRWRI